MREKVEGAIDKDREPSTLECFNLVTRMGKAMLLNGGEIFRTNEAMRYAAKALGLQDFSAYVIANGIFASIVSEGKVYSSKICSVPLAPIMLCRVEALNSLSRRIAVGKCSPSEIREELERIETMNSSGNLLKILASGSGSASFCYLFKGSLMDSIAAFAAAAVLYIFLVYTVPKVNLPRIMVNILGSALVSFLCCGLYSIGVGDKLDRIIIGAIFPMVPGIPLTNSVRNFLENDYLSGMIRLVDTLLTAGCIAIGVGISMRIWSIAIGGIL